MLSWSQQECPGQVAARPGRTRERFGSHRRRPSACADLRPRAHLGQSASGKEAQMNEAVQAKQVFKDNPQLRHFLFELFQCSGMFGNLYLPGRAWSLKLLSSDVGGSACPIPTWLTLNIGTHDLAHPKPQPVGNK